MAPQRNNGEGLLSGLLSKILNKQLNSVVAGSLALISAAFGWSILSMCGSQLIKVLFTTYTIPKSSPIYPHFLSWLRNQEVQSSVIELCIGCSAASQRRKGDRIAYAVEDEALPDEPASNMNMITSSGTVYYRNCYLWVSTGLIEGDRTDERTTPRNDANNFLPSITMFTLFGYRNDIIRRIIYEGRCIEEEASRYNTTVYSSDLQGGRGQYGYRDLWRKIAVRPARSMDSIILPNNQLKELLSDCKEFLSSEKWYCDREIPFRRGYLLWGNSGCGKTSVIAAIAGALELSIFQVPLTAVGLSDNSLVEVFNSAPINSILLLEDIDAIFGAVWGLGQLTFAGLLNAIDGVAAQTGRLLFMTTNHREQLDPALTRPGRIDYEMEFKEASRYQGRWLFEKFYSNAVYTKYGVVKKDASLSLGEDRTEYPMVLDATLRSSKETVVDLRQEAAVKEITRLSDLFAQSMPDGVYSMSTLQSIFMNHRGNPYGVLDTVKHMESTRIALKHANTEGRAATAETVRSGAEEAEDLSPCLPRTNPIPNSGLAGQYLNLITSSTGKCERKVNKAVRDIVEDDAVAANASTSSSPRPVAPTSTSISASTPNSTSSPAFLPTPITTSSTSVPTPTSAAASPFLGSVALDLDKSLDNADVVTNGDPASSPLLENYYA